MLYVGCEELAEHDTMHFIAKSLYAHCASDSKRTRLNRESHTRVSTRSQKNKQEQTQNKKNNKQQTTKLVPLSVLFVVCFVFVCVNVGSPVAPY